VLSSECFVKKFWVIYCSNIEDDVVLYRKRGLFVVKVFCGWVGGDMKASCKYKEFTTTFCC